MFASPESCIFYLFKWRWFLIRMGMPSYVSVFAPTLSPWVRIHRTWDETVAMALVKWGLHLFLLPTTDGISVTRGWKKTSIEKKSHKSSHVDYKCTVNTFLVCVLCLTHNRCNCHPFTYWWRSVLSPTATRMTWRHVPWYLTIHSFSPHSNWKARLPAAIIKLFPKNCFFSGILCFTELKLCLRCNKLPLELTCTLTEVIVWWFTWLLRGVKSCFPHSVCLSNISEKDRQPSLLTWSWSLIKLHRKPVSSLNDDCEWLRLPISIT